MTRLLSFCLLAIPSAYAMVAYAVPASLAALVEADADCKLPDDFNVQNFVAKSPDGGKKLDSFNFTFLDDSTNVTTPCTFNSTSTPIGQPGRTPRFACDNSWVQFIWQNGTLTLIEGICPGADGKTDFEASGTILLPLICDSAASNDTCGSTGGCKANSTDIQSKFFSLQPTPQ